MGKFTHEELYDLGGETDLTEHMQVVIPCQFLLCHDALLKPEGPDPVTLMWESFGGRVRSQGLAGLHLAHISICHISGTTTK